MWGIWLWCPAQNAAPLASDIVEANRSGPAMQLAGIPGGPVDPLSQLAAWHRAWGAGLATAGFAGADAPVLAIGDPAEVLGLGQRCCGSTAACMSDGAASAAELRVLRNIVEDLTFRVQELERGLVELRVSQPVAAPVTVNYSVSAAPAASSPRASTSPVVGSPAPSKKGAAAYTEEERRSVAEQIGGFLRRSLQGDHRGESGRNRISLPNRVYILCRDIAGNCYDPVKVFHTFGEVKAFTHSAGGQLMAAELEQLDDLPDLEQPLPIQIRHCTVLQGEEIDSDYPVGVLEIAPTLVDGFEIQKVAVILIRELGGHLVCAFPSKAWHRTAAKRVLPAGALQKPFAAEVLFRDRSSEEEETYASKVWLGLLSLAIEDKVTFQSAAFETVEPDLLFDPNGPEFVPVASSIVALAEEQFSFVSATSGDGGRDRTKVAEDVPSRLSSLKAGLQALTESVQKLVERDLPKPARASALRSPSQPLQDASATPPPGLPSPKPAGWTSGQKLDLEVVRAARMAGIPEKQIAEMAELAAAGRPKLADFPSQSAKKKVVRNVLSESEEEEEPGPDLGDQSDPDASISVAVAKLTQIATHLTAQQVKSKSLDALLDGVGSGPSSEAGSVPGSRKHIAALRILRKTLRSQPTEISKVIERNMLEDFQMRQQAPGSDPVQVSARGWLEMRSRVQGFATPVRFLWGIAAVLDCLRSNQIEEARARCGLLLAQGDQLSIDRGSWVIAGEIALEDSPPMAAFNQHTLPSELESPYTRLIGSRWFDLFLQKLNDYDSLSEKKKKLNAKRSNPNPASTSSDANPNVECRLPDGPEPSWLQLLSEGDATEFDAMLQDYGLSDDAVARIPAKVVPPQLPVEQLPERALQRRAFAQQQRARTRVTKGKPVKNPPVPQPRFSPWLPRRKLRSDCIEALKQIPRSQFVLPKGVSLETALQFPGHCDLFSGSRGAARALAAKTGRWVLCYDIKNSPREDLLSSAIQQEVEHLLCLEAFLSVTAGPVCASFSRAVCPAVRTKAEPLGIAGMTPSMQEKVRQGNLFAAWLATLLQKVIKQQLVFWVENPGSSFLWQHPDFVALQLQHGLQFFLTDYCRWGTPWRKRTKFSGGFSAAGLRLLCNCNQKHVKLRGYSKQHRTSWTKVAEPYPARLCRFLAMATAESLKPFSRQAALDVAACAKCSSCRVGEAKNPGPVRSHRRTGADLEQIQLISPATAMIQQRIHERFCSWLEQSLSAESLEAIQHNPQLQVYFLRTYGNWLYQQGQALYLFRHLVVYLQQMFPSERPAVAPAWELLARWESVQPVTHRPPMPRPILEAMTALALSWGWLRWAAVTNLAFFGAMRVGEPLKACRSDLMLPADASLPPDTCFLQVGAPKPGRRGRGRVQHARINDRQAVELAVAAFGALEPDALLYPVAPATYRRRWDHLLTVLEIPKRAALTPGGLRGGGACLMYHNSVPVSDILWRMRLRHLATLEFYIQEAAATNIMQKLPRESRDKITSCSSMLPLLARAFTSSSSAR
eukprot:Skav223451  [mRNA]  locus=scaffold350:925896:940241:- [translate_table: standard]